jgi:hypothetical protein
MLEADQADALVISTSEVRQASSETSSAKFFRDEPIQRFIHGLSRCAERLFDGRLLYPLRTSPPPSGHTARLRAVIDGGREDFDRHPLLSLIAWFCRCACADLLAWDDMTDPDADESVGSIRSPGEGDA